MSLKSDQLELGFSIVQIFNRTSLSDRAAYRVRDFGNSAKIQGRTQKYHVPAPPKCQASRVKK